MGVFGPDLNQWFLSKEGPDVSPVENTRRFWEGKIMRTFLSLLFALALTSAANAQDSPYRKELKRADLTGTNMEGDS